MVETNQAKQVLCGLWVNSEATVHLYWRDAPGRDHFNQDCFQPFAWSTAIPGNLSKDDFLSEPLEGPGDYNYLLRFKRPEVYTALLKDRSQPVSFESIRLLENQYLLARQLRLFGGLKFGEIRRMQLDIETGCSVEGGFSDPDRPGDRILAIGMQIGEEKEILEIEDYSDAGERVLLKQFGERLLQWDPDVIEGHNIFNFDLKYLHCRARRYRVKPQWGRFGQVVKCRNSRLRVAERWLDFLRMDIPGRTVFDTYLMIQVFDVTMRDLPSYGLKEVARRLGITPMDGGERTYLAGADIEKTFQDDRETFRCYLEDDLRETKGVADRLLPTYLAQVQSFPMLLQEACLRGTANKVDTLFLEKYYHAGFSLPAPGKESVSFEGGYSRSFETGVFQKVLHYDVASLYPSILLWLNRNPGNDPLGAFIPLLRELRQYRLECKNRARTVEDSEMRQEYEARQASYKILINSFYGYLGFPGARFGDYALAAEVTARGREFLQALIEQFQKEGCTVLEADTDGIYIRSEKDWEHPEGLLERVKTVLPEGIDLEYDGRYQSMLCYKAKNYALYDGQKITIRGSALRSRGMEPFLKELTLQLIEYLLGVSEASPAVRYQALWKQLDEQTLPVEKLAKSEYLSMSPEAYRKKMERGGKPRRAALEVALSRREPLKTGDPVAYYIQVGEKGKRAAWQRARAVEYFDPQTAPYDPKYYQKKLKDWWKRYESFLPEEPDPGEGGSQLSMEV